VWARNEHQDLRAAHGAAGAAVKAERSGADPVQAAVAGARKAEREDANPSVRVRELGNWYVWAIDDRKMPTDQALALAQKVAKAFQQGLNHSQAFDMALAISRGERVRGLSLVGRVTRDPGLFVFVVAVVVFLLAIFSGLGAFFVLIALVSFVVPLRSARFVGRFTPMMALAMLVNIGTIVVVALGLKV
jgi:hypothetical protein